MIVFAYIALFATPLLAVVAFLSSRANVRNVALFIVLSWLFLPLVGIKLSEGIPVYDKATAVGIGMLIGLVVVRLDAFLRLRPTWIDIPMIIWCLVPIASSLSNDLGLYDGLAAAFRQFMVWGVPYFAGRLLFGNYDALFELGRVLLIGGAIYFPFCLYESRMSAQLHLMIYGIAGLSSYETADFFGLLKFKASVFLESTLELTPLMGAAALCGLWLWKTSRLKQLWGIHIGWFIAAASLSCILGKSLGGFSLTVGGAIVLFLSKMYNWKAFSLALLMVSPLYILTRSTNVWTGAEVVDFLKQEISERRAESFNTRLVNEDQLIAKAMERPVFGWGGWGRNRVYDANGKDLSLTDGMWVIAMGTNGVVGLIALYGALLLPVGIVLMRFEGRLLWNEPQIAPIFVMAVIVVLHSIDFLENAMSNPIYMVALGGLARLAAQPILLEEQAARMVRRPSIAHVAQGKLVWPRR